MNRKFSIEEIVSRLEARGPAVKRSGNEYRAQCPAHQGAGLNLAFTEGKNGHVVFTCHSRGCKYEEIVKALGIEKQESEPNKPKKAAFGKKVHPTLMHAVKAAAFGAQQQTLPDYDYRYGDEHDFDAFHVVRWDTDNGKNHPSHHESRRRVHRRHSRRPALSDLPLQ